MFREKTLSISDSEILCFYVFIHIQISAVILTLTRNLQHEHTCKYITNCTCLIFIQNNQFILRRYELNYSLEFQILRYKYCTKYCIISVLSFFFHHNKQILDKKYLFVLFQLQRTKYYILELDLVLSMFQKPKMQRVVFYSWFAKV